MEETRKSIEECEVMQEMSKLRVGLSYKSQGTDFRKISLRYLEVLSPFWQVFLMGLGKLFWRGKVSVGGISKLTFIYPQMFNSGGRVRGLWAERIYRDVYDCGLYKAVKTACNRLGVYGISGGISKEEYEEWLGMVRLFIETGFAFYFGYPLEYEESPRPKEMSAGVFNNKLLIEFAKLDDVSQLRVYEHIKSMGLSTRLDSYERIAANIAVATAGVGAGIDVSPSASKLDKRSIEERLGKALKNMGEWTEQDFWDEMTELYGLCKDASDLKAMRSLLEMRGKAMGILSADNQPVANPLVIVMDRAMGALASMGLAQRKVIDVE